jgi:hypothetical protein
MSVEYLSASPLSRKAPKLCACKAETSRVDATIAIPNADRSMQESKRAQDLAQHQNRWYISAMQPAFQTQGLRLFYAPAAAKKHNVRPQLIVHGQHRIYEMSNTKTH